MKSRSQDYSLPTIALMAIIALSGCGKIRYPTSYVLNFPAPAPRIPAMQQGALEPLEVREFRCPAYLCEGRIAYRPSPEEVGYYEYHRWALSPREAITRLMVDTLRAHSLFKTVSFHETGMKPPYVLSGSIERLEEVDEGRNVRAVCTISAQLVDVRTRSVIWKQTASETVSLEKRNMNSLVRSLSSASRITVDRLAESMALALSPGRSLDSQQSDHPSADRRDQRPYGETR